jgi:hypothetical protein
MKCHLFHFISLSNTFSLMPKVKVGKETVKLLAIFDHPLAHAKLTSHVGRSRFTFEISNLKSAILHDLAPHDLACSP